MSITFQFSRLKNFSSQNYQARAVENSPGFCSSPNFYVYCFEYFWYLALRILKHIHKALKIIQYMYLRVAYGISSTVSDTDNSPVSDTDNSPVADTDNSPVSVRYYLT